MRDISTAERLTGLEAQLDHLVETLGSIRTSLESLAAATERTQQRLAEKVDSLEERLREREQEARDQRLIVRLIGCLLAGAVAISGQPVVDHYLDRVEAEARGEPV